MSPDPPAKLVVPAAAPVGPILRALAAPAKLTVVAAVLTRLKVVAEVLRVPPFTARFPPMLALLVTDRAVPAALKVVAPVKVLAVVPL